MIEHYGQADTIPRKRSQKRLSIHFGDYLARAEVLIYSIVAVMLFVTALATIANAGKLLWDGLGPGRLPP